MSIRFDRTEFAIVSVYLSETHNDVQTMHSGPSHRPRSEVHCGDTAAGCTGHLRADGCTGINADTCMQSDSSRTRVGLGFVVSS